MANAILLSLIAATVIVPAIGAYDRSARRGLKRTLLAMIAIEIVYVALLIFVYVRRYAP